MYTETIPAATLTALRAEFGIADTLDIVFSWDYENDVSPEDSFDDAETVQWVREQMEHSNAAWFHCRVTVTDGDAEGSDCLGACSYRSFAEFLTPETGNYFRDMVSSAFDAYTADAERLSAKYA
jgi:hypothetical protein